MEVLNREQNRLDLYFVDAASGKSQRVLSETSPNWVEVNDVFRVLKSGDQFLWQSWRDGHTHLYLYSFDKNNPLGGEAKLVRQLTHGDYETFTVDAVDDSSGTVFYTSNQGDARQRQLWSVKLSGGEPVRVSREAGTHAASFPDNGGTYYVDTFSAQMTPPSMSLCHTGQCTPFWQSKAVTDYSFIAPRFVDFRADDGTLLQGELLMPPADVVQRAGGKVPLILDPYGGPGAQTVRDAWGGTTFLFHQIMARRGFAILRVDNRGMAGRGQKFASALRHNFGETELKDQLTALEQALAQFPQLDRDRLGWWGWSYGGFLTLYAMTHSPLLKAGVAVAPVTDWHDYDTIYTERYMGLPKQNADGYQKSSPVNSAPGLKGRLLEVHGTGDDNVHMQNTIQMLNAFVNAGKEVDVMLYPRKTHSIAGPEARTNLFTKIRRHFEERLLGEQIRTADVQPSE
jgi:dipeptidyl-peptidase-4